MRPASVATLSVNRWAQRLSKVLRDELVHQMSSHHPKMLGVLESEVEQYCMSGAAARGTTEYNQIQSDPIRYNQSTISSLMRFPHALTTVTTLLLPLQRPKVVP